MQAFVVFATILALSNMLAITAPLSSFPDPLEAETIPLAVVVGPNTSAIDMHHIFQTMELIVQANKVALTSHKSFTHKLNYTTIDNLKVIDSEATLCDWLTSDHRRAIFYLEHHAVHTIHTKNTTTITVTTTGTEVIDDDQANYGHCLKLGTEGLNDAKELAHKLYGMQKAAMALRKANAGRIETRKIKFWHFGDWWVPMLCAWRPTWCHEEDDDE